MAKPPTNGLVLDTPELPARSIEDAVGTGVWDAVVVGAGVAGSTIARLLARRGASVLLVEKKRLPRYKVCGCCLNRRSLHFLERAGIAARLAALGAPSLDSISLHAGKNRALLALPDGMAVSRDQLDLHLAQAACDGGAVLLQGTRARLDRVPGGGDRTVKLRDRAAEGHVRARLVIAADGLAGRLMEEGGGGVSRVARGAYLGLGALAEDSDTGIAPGQIHMYCGRQGYVGLVRVEGSFLALAAAVQPDALRNEGGPEACIRRVFRDAGALPPLDLSRLDLKGTPILTRRSGHLGGDRLIALGDSAGYVEPFTGEGMAWAFEAAWRLDAHLGSSVPSQWGEAVPAWEKDYRRLMLKRQICCKGLSLALRSPGLTAFSVGLLATVPALSTPVVNALNSLNRSHHAVP